MVTIGILIGCLVTVAILGGIGFVVYRRYIAPTELSPEERYPPAEPTAQGNDGAQGEVVEGAIMVPVENKSIFLRCNDSIALTCIPSEKTGCEATAMTPRSECRTESVSSFSSNCSTCVADECSPWYRGNVDNVRAAVAQQPLITPPTCRALEEDVNTTRNRRVTFCSLPGSPTAVRGPMLRTGRADSEPVNSSAFEGSHTASDSQHHHCHHHREILRVEQKWTGTHHKPHSGEEGTRYPSQRVDDATHRTCQLYKRRDSSQVYGASLYWAPGEAGSDTGYVVSPHIPDCGALPPY